MPGKWSTGKNTDFFHLLHRTPASLADPFSCFSQHQRSHFVTVLGTSKQTKHGECECARVCHSLRSEGRSRIMVMKRAMEKTARTWTKWLCGLLLLTRHYQTSVTSHLQTLGGQPQRIHPDLDRVYHVPIIARCPSVVNKIRSQSL